LHVSSGAGARRLADHRVFSIEESGIRPGPRSLHAFAVALQEAIADFRKADNRRFDHEYLWAPYTRYGLG
jgi:hypothetical protein